MVETVLDNAAANGADLESDIVVFHRPESSRKNYTRLALVLLIALLAAIAVGIAVSADNGVMSDPPASRASVQEAKPFEEGDSPTVGQGSIVVDAPAPAPAPDNLMTLHPSSGGTVTVSTETSSPPTVSDRDDRRSMIQSPTLRG